MFQNLSNFANSTQISVIRNGFPLPNCAVPLATMASKRANDHYGTHAADRPSSTSFFSQSAMAVWIRGRQPASSHIHRPIPNDLELLVGVHAKKCRPINTPPSFGFFEKGLATGSGVGWKAVPLRVGHVMRMPSMPRRERTSLTLFCFRLMATVHWELFFYLFGCEPSRKENGRSFRFRTTILTEFTFRPVVTCHVLGGRFRKLAGLWGTTGRENCNRLCCAILNLLHSARNSVVLLFVKCVGNYRETSAYLYPLFELLAAHFFFI